MGYSNSKGISAAVLKHIAVITMTIDHVTAFLVKDWLRSQGVFQLYDSGIYTFGRIIGRIAFVLYAFMIAEGAARTHNKAKYAGRLLLLALISVVPHSYANSGKWFNPSDLNIFFLLFTGLLVIYAYDWLKGHTPNPALSILLRIAVIAAASAIALIFKFEYGMMGILLILGFYLCRDNFPRMAVCTVLIMTVGYVANVILRTGAVTWFQRYSGNLLNAMVNADRIQFFGILALPLIYFYNGEKGRQLPKAFYYLFYPVHLGIIALILYL